MNFHILTLFPEMVLQGLAASVIGRAAEKNIVSIEAINIRDYTLNKHRRVDDYTYGGGAGMLMQAQPIYDAWCAVTEKIRKMQPSAAYSSASCSEEMSGESRRIRTIYVTPQGRPFTQKMARELSREKDLIFLCGHYEGVDERVLEEIVTDYVSIGDYVLTGGELPAMVMVDAIARLVPGALHNETSADIESFHNDLLEYPQYSRPEEWRGKSVPEVLLTGNHKDISQWRLERAKERTKAVRPDLYEIYEKKQEVIKTLSSKKRSYIHMMESLARGKGKVLYARGKNVLIWDELSRHAMISAQSREEAEGMIGLLPSEVESVMSSQEFLNELLCSQFPLQVHNKCWQICYTRREPLRVKYKDIRRLTQEHLPYVAQNYHYLDKVHLEQRIAAGALYGAFLEDVLIGFVGIHDDGSTGLLFVEENYRRKGIGESLLAFVANLQKGWGWIPYGHIVADNEKALRLQEKLGFLCSGDNVWWLEKKHLQ